MDVVRFLPVGSNVTSHIISMVIAMFDESHRSEMPTIAAKRNLQPCGVPDLKTLQKFRVT